MDQFLDLEEDFDLDPLDMQAHQYDFFPDLLQQEAAHPPPPPPLPEMEQPQPPPPEMVDAIPDSVKSDCRINVLSLFPDIDPDHLTLLCEEGLWQSDGIIEQILNQQEEGKQYPKAPKPNLKRKRDDEENPILQWDNLERRSQQRPLGYLKTSCKILQLCFPELYVDDLRRVMVQHGQLLLPTFLALHKTLRDWDHQKPPYRKKTRVNKKLGDSALEDTLDERILDANDHGEREALEEFRAAYAVKQKDAAEAETVRRKEQEELDNFEMARAEGNVADCGCCFTELAMNRMVHCDSSTLHWFCQACARMMAETQIGLSKHDLSCMSIDGCSGGFALDQREMFLDAPSRTALDRIEAESALREAGIEDLETCPFCPFAMEYPSLELEKEFRCLKPDCKMVSCRACRKETHIPKTCEEAALETGHSARHTIEEAMSAALIRKCNKCSAPFIKENGCNKMTCTKCMNIQCYVCSKSCDYSHFDDSKRGGKRGNCPLFDQEGVEVRHSAEVKTAETEARKKVLEEHSDLTADLLEIRAFENEERSEVSIPRHGHAHFRLPPGLEGRAHVRRYLEMRRARAQRVALEEGMDDARVNAHMNEPMQAAQPLVNGPPPGFPPAAFRWDWPVPQAAPPPVLPGNPGEAFRGGAGFAPGIRQRMPQPFAPFGAPPPDENANHPHRLGAAPEVKSLGTPRQGFLFNADLGGHMAVNERLPEDAGIDDPPQDDLWAVLSPDQYSIPQQDDLQQSMAVQQPMAAQEQPVQYVPQRPPFMPFIPRSPVDVPLDPRGRNALQPIDLSSPQSVVDLTGEENPQGNGGRQETSMQRGLNDLIDDVDFVAGGFDFYEDVFPQGP